MNNKQIEQYAIQHWPAHQAIHYDGWNINFSNGYTKRANCINVIEDSSLPLESKISHCEQLYKAKHLPTIFKLASFQSIYELDERLDEKGYIKEGESFVLTMKINNLTLSGSDLYSVDQSSCPTEEWLHFQVESKHLSVAERATLMQILDRMACEVCYFTIKDEGVVVACCLGTLEDSCVSVYSLVTAESHRKKGLATQLLLQLFKWAEDKGATSSYILVEADNLPAVSLYYKLGYNHQYSYWYRIKK